MFKYVACKHEKTLSSHKIEQLSKELLYIEVQRRREGSLPVFARRESPKLMAEGTSIYKYTKGYVIYCGLCRLN